MFINCSKFDTRGVMTDQTVRRAVGAGRNGYPGNTDYIPAGDTATARTAAY